MPSYTSALAALSSQVVTLVKHRLPSKKRFQVHCVDIVGSYMRIYVTKAGVPATPFDRHKNVRFIEITQAKHDQDKWQVGFGEDLSSNEPLGKMIGFFYPKTEASNVLIAKYANAFFSTGSMPSTRQEVL